MEQRIEVIKANHNNETLIVTKHTSLKEAWKDCRAYMSAGAEGYSAVLRIDGVTKYSPFGLVKAK